MGYLPMPLQRGVQTAAVAAAVRISFVSMAHPY
jgi:hypothetical protein